MINHHIRTVEQHSCTEVDHVKPQRSQQCAEGAVEFKAPTASALLHDLRDGPLEGCLNADAVEHMQVFKRHSAEMGPLEPFQRFEIHRDRSREADALKVRVNVETSCRDH